MKKLSPATVPPSYIGIFEQIRNNKKKIKEKNALIRKQAAIRHRFIEYETKFAAGTLSSMAASQLTSLREALRSCYGRNKAMNALKQAIKDAQPSGCLLWCPYCGATTPTSYDHYLPAEEFPEFAAHGLNIVPACSRCNSTKDDDWLSGGARQYLHFYSDQIPNVPFLTVSVTSDTAARAVGATFALQQAGMPPGSWLLLEAHFRKLKLIDLYDEYANDLITTILRSARSHINAGGPSAATFLANEASENANLYGEYGWRAVLLRSMSSHPHLMQWIAWL